MAVNFTIVRLDSQVNFGNFNPPHWMHGHMFEVARQYLSKKTNFVAVGGFYCPTHDKMGACAIWLRQDVCASARMHAPAFPVFE